MHIRPVVVIGVSLVLLFGGCAGHHAVFTEGTSAIATGEWKDLGPALAVALDRSQLSILSSTRSEDGSVLTYELLGVHDEPGTLTLTRKLPGVAVKGEGPIPIEIRAAIGRFGDEARERKLIADIRSRLGDLVGTDVAPIR